MIAIMTALALSGCMRTAAPVAAAQPQSGLDSLAYGQPYEAAPASVASSPSHIADSGGAISALRASFAAAPRHSYAPSAVAYAAAPMPVAHEAAYRLDARDKLRVVI
jgi:polysaccharide export outer membrane protein